MRATERRLLDADLLPSYLWDEMSGTLFLPPDLARAYGVLIDRHHLREIAVERNSDDPPIGGHSQEKTDEHFAQAFDGSVARVQLAVIDPKMEVTRASNAFIQMLSGNRVCLIDAPCGAGAAAFAFLTTIAELRSKEVLPRQPLDITLIGAELSQPARTYAAELLKELQPFLENQAIFVQEEFTHWDVLDQMVNTDLIQKITRCSPPPAKRLLLVANFNGFLERDGKRRLAEPQMAELFRHTSGDASIAVWIEPQMNQATKKGGLFSSVAQWVEKGWRFFARVNTEGDLPDLVLTSECLFQSPLHTVKAHQVRLAVMRLDLNRTAK